MRIAFFSDLHLEWRDAIVADIFAGSVDLMIMIEMIPCFLEADVLVIAGDIHHDVSVREALKALLQAFYGIPVLMTEGNHDFYGQPFPADQQGEIVVVDKIVFALAPLWTRLRPLDEALRLGFPDFKKIEGITVEKWNRAHQNQLAFFRAVRADVVVAHHSPFWESLDQYYERDGNNCFFASNLSLYDFDNCKLLIHGHIHQSRDYMLGDLRVVCSPVGYPWLPPRGYMRVITI
jgi:DNA repair exonuclease SbcCD nuclease subunit